MNKPVSIPDKLKIDDLEIHYWTEILNNYKPQKKVFFHDASKGIPDPDFRYLTIVFEKPTGFDGYYLVCYFDDEGTWITQTPFESLDQAFAHGTTAFGIPKEMWNKPLVVTGE